MAEKIIRSDIKTEIKIANVNKTLKSDLKKIAKHNDVTLSKLIRTTLHKLVDENKSILKF